MRPFGSSLVSLLSITLILLAAISAGAQNLVPNGSFEEGFPCPTGVANLDAQCANWYSSIVPEGDEQPTPEWYHTCAELDFMAPPDVVFGNQETAEGNGYAGIITYRVVQNIPNYREIIGVELNEALVIGQSYLIEFEVSSLNLGGFYLVNNNIGFNFSTHPTYHRDAFPINQSHFSIDTILTFSDQWSSVSAVFEADSAYNYLHIGNFFDDANTLIEVESEFSQAGYYVVDDVRVSSTTNTSFLGNNRKGHLIFPNPTTGSVRLMLPQKITNPSIQIFSLEGVQVTSELGVHFANNETIDLSFLTPGVYIFRVVTKNLTYNEKIIKL